MPKAVKLADIAKSLGVSTVTVSKALSGQKGVSEEMREKIKQLADELGYVKIVSPVKSENRKSYTFGVIVAERYVDGNQSFYWQLYQEVSQNAIRRNCFAMLEVVSDDAEQKIELPKIVVEEKVEAVVVMGTFQVEYAAFLRKNIHLPLVFLDTLDNESGSDAVVTSNMMAAYRMTNYLFEMGHSRIGFVGTRLSTASIDDRYFGYLKSAMEHGMEVAQEWLVDDRDRMTGRFDYEKRFLLPESNMPTAFFCNCDMAANVLIRKLTAHGYSVPQDVSVAGFDDYLQDPFSPIGITTYAINTKEMARKVVHILIHKLENPEYSTGVYMVAGKFIERESVKRIGDAVPFV